MPTKDEKENKVLEVSIRPLSTGYLLTTRRERGGAEQIAAETPAPIKKLLESVGISCTKLSI